MTSTAPAPPLAVTFGTVIAPMPAPVRPCSASATLSTWMELPAATSRYFPFFVIARPLAGMSEVVMKYEYCLLIVVPLPLTSTARLVGVVAKMTLPSGAATTPNGFPLGSVSRLVGSVSVFPAATAALRPGSNSGATTVCTFSFGLLSARYAPPPPSTTTMTRAVTSASGERHFGRCRAGGLSVRWPVAPPCQCASVSPGVVCWGRCGAISVAGPPTAKAVAPGSDPCPGALTPPGGALPDTAPTSPLGQDASSVRRGSGPGLVPGPESYGLIPNASRMASQNSRQLA